MKIEKLTKDNIKEFMRDLVLEDSELENNINKLEYYGVKDDDTFYIAFTMLSVDDTIAIKYINKKLSEDKFLDFINYLNNSLVVKSHLIVQVYDDKFINILNNNYRCKEVYVSLGDNIGEAESTFKEKYAEIDMHNIRYLHSKNEIVCNLIKQNIQDMDIINRLHEHFINLNSNKISFIIYDGLFDIFNDLGYKTYYRNFVIENI